MFSNSPCHNIKSTMPSEPEQTSASKHSLHPASLMQQPALQAICHTSLWQRSPLPLALAVAQAARQGWLNTGSSSSSGGRSPNTICNGKPGATEANQQKRRVKRQYARASSRAAISLHAGSSHLSECKLHTALNRHFRASSPRS